MNTNNAIILAINIKSNFCDQSLKITEGIPGNLRPSTYLCCKNVRIDRLIYSTSDRVVLNIHKYIFVSGIPLRLKKRTAEDVSFVKKVWGSVLDRRPKL